jgi:inosine-uridine nucleoside N-ribohydrolase
VLLAVLVLAALAVLTLALPIRSWRTGESATAAVAFDLEPAPRMHGQIWIDTDAACGHGDRTDPDDCFAILLLARTAGARLQGISTVFGNADVQTVSRTTEELLRQLGNGHLVQPRLPVYPGAATPASANDSKAVLGLQRALEAGPLEILALGPLTNVARALAHRPDLIRNVRGLVAVMGRREGHWFHPAEGHGSPSFLGHGPVFRDFNFQKDSQAAARLLAAGVPITLVPYEAARGMMLTAADLDRIEASGPAGAWLAQRSRGWLRYWREEIGRPGFYPFDLVAAALAVHPAAIHCAKASASISSAEPPFGWLGARALFVARPGARDAGVAYCPEVTPALRQWLRDALAAQL